jgi:hypothetical protein
VLTGDEVGRLVAAALMTVVAPLVAALRSGHRPPDWPTFGSDDRQQ